MAENVETKSRRRRKRNAEDEGAEDIEKGVTTGKGTITPGRRTRKDVESDGGGNIITRSLRGMNIYRKGVSDELSKVTWPTRDELRHLSVIVIIALIASSIALGALSFAFTELFILGFGNELVFAVMFAVIILGFVAFTRLGRNNNTPY